MFWWELIHRIMFSSATGTSSAVLSYQNLFVERNKSEVWKRKLLLSLNTLARQALEKKKSCLCWKTTLVLENKYKMAINTFRLEISRKCLTTRKVWNSPLTAGGKPIHCCFTKAPAFKMECTFWNVVFTLCGFVIIQKQPTSLRVSSRLRTILPGTERSQGRKEETQKASGIQLAIFKKLNNCLQIKAWLDRSLQLFLT